MTLEFIQKLIDRPINFDNREDAEKKLNDLLSTLGHSAKIKAQAHGNLERKKGEVMRSYPDLNYRLLKLRIDSETAAEQEQFVLAERINVSLFKAIDGLKALLNVQDKTEEVKWN